eukprot:gene254-biopygen22572
MAETGVPLTVHDARLLVGRSHTAYGARVFARSRRAQPRARAGRKCRGIRARANACDESGAPAHAGLGLRRGDSACPVSPPHAQAKRRPAHF